MSVSAPEFRELVDHLQQARETLLKKWRAAVKSDVDLTTGDALPQVQLDDHVPAVLIAFEAQLSSLQDAERKKMKLAAVASADAHGMHRWQQGYDLHEVVRELGHLNSILVTELDAFAENSDTDSKTMAVARLAWARVYAVGVEQSTQQFFQLQQRESKGHVKDLEVALADITELDRQRASLWQQLAHDLRGNVGVVATASRALAFKNSPDSARERFVNMLERNVDSLRHLLDDVTSLTRLHAGIEHRKVAAFDVTTLLSSMCEGLQALAEHRGLYLRHVGPTGEFVVEGDAVKVRRLAQNLIINALKYTEKGGVDVQWSPRDGDDKKRWELSVRDTGPGLNAGPGSPLAEALKKATDLSHDIAEVGGLPDTKSVSKKPPAAQPHGEGIGLSIVKMVSRDAGCDY